MTEKAVIQFLTRNVENRTHISGETSAERLDALVKLGKKQGFEFTADECTSVLETARKYQAGELSDEQLEAVAGGGVWDEIAGALYRAAEWLVGESEDEDDGSNWGVAGVRG